MSTGPLVLVLIAALAHAAWNIASKYARGDIYLFVWSYTALSAALCLMVGVAVPAARGSAHTWTLLLAASVSAALHVVYSLVLQRGYQVADVGSVYPIARGTGPLLTMIIAIAILGERPGLLPTVGAVVVIAGVVVVVGNPFARGPALVPVLWGVATGAAIAGYTLWDSYSIASSHLQPIAYFATTLVVETALLSPWAVRHRAGLRAAVAGNGRVIAIVAVLSPLAYILVLEALRSLPVAIVAPLRESSIVVAALASWWLFREQHIVRRLTGAVVVLAGIVLISLP